MQPGGLTSLGRRGLRALVFERFLLTSSAALALFEIPIGGVAFDRHFFDGRRLILLRPQECRGAGLLLTFPSAGRGALR